MMDITKGFRGPGGDPVGVLAQYVFNNWRGPGSTKMRIKRRSARKNAKKARRRNRNR